GGTRLFAVAWNARVGFAKTLGTHDCGGNSGLHQEVADSFGATLRELQVVGLCAAVVRISVDCNRISLERHQDPGDAIEDVAIFRFNVCLVKVEANRLAVERHHQAHGGATRFGNLPESLLQLCKLRLSLSPI